MMGIPRLDSCAGMVNALHGLNKEALYADWALEILSHPNTNISRLTAKEVAGLLLKYQIDLTKVGVN